MPQVADVHHEDEEREGVKYRVAPCIGKPGLWIVTRGKHIIYEDTFAECCGIMVEFSRR